MAKLSSERRASDSRPWRAGTGRGMVVFSPYYQSTEPAQPSSQCRGRGSSRPEETVQTKPYIRQVQILTNMK